MKNNKKWKVKKIKQINILHAHEIGRYNQGRTEPRWAALSKLKFLIRTSEIIKNHPITYHMLEDFTL